MTERTSPFGADAAVAVVGLGSSGVAAARLARARGARVYASDVAAGESQREAAETLRGEGIDAEAGGHDLERVISSDLAVVSPGIDPSTEVRRALREAGVRTIAEIELAYRCLRSSLVAVTGTNGKTTTTALCGHLLVGAGVDAETAGNIGRPLSEIALGEEQPEWVVAEVSSFQLADIETFRPDVGVMLNLAPDHLDRYGSVESYYADKERFFANAGPGSRWVLNAADEDVGRAARGAEGECFLYSVEPTTGAAAYVDREEWLRLDLPGRRERWARVGDLQLLGGHNVANALAAGLAAALVGCGGEKIGRGLSTFEGLPHRLQPVLTDGDGVLWVNDSKATNVLAAAAAIRAFRRPVVLLLGGRGKGESFAGLAPLLGERVRGVVAFGEAAPRIVSELEGAGVPIAREDGMEPLVRRAGEMASAGDVVLFSPACASYDMYSDYQARGRAFEAAVHALRPAGRGVS